MVQILIKQCMERLWIFNVSINNSSIKYQIGKSIFAVTLPFKIFPVSVANAGNGSLKSLDIHSVKMFVPHAIEI